MTLTSSNPSAAMSNDCTAPDFSRARLTNVTDLLPEIEELRRAAEKLGHGTLAFFLDCAGIEASAQARLHNEEQRLPTPGPVQRSDVRI
jgi:hypothetical protein